MIDTHCHLTDLRLANQIDSVLSCAAAAGVSRMVTIGTHPEDWDPTLRTCENQSHIRCAIGIHPNHCHQAELSQVALLRGYQQNPAVVALGEMGLDYHYTMVPKPRQAEFFEAQLQLASELNRPVVIHCREAAEDCLTIMKSFPDVSAVFHCFTGVMSDARRILDRGYYLGFTGVVTYKNAPELRDIAMITPADRILVETDAPYLTPEPMRKQKINEPAMVIHTAAFVANARQMTLEEFDSITTVNALKFFRAGADWQPVSRAC